jgi:2'-5' RNA ligase
MINLSEIIRLFIAIPIDTSLKKKFNNLTSELKTFSADIKWVEEENFHITLKFLGETPGDKLQQIIAQCEKPISKIETFNMNFKGIGAFPNLRYPKVIWIGISEGHKQLIELANSIEEPLQILNFPKEKRPCSPHLTLGRVRSPKGLINLTNELKKLSVFEGGSMKVSEVHLMKSVLTKKGPIYSIMNQFKLKN